MSEPSAPPRSFRRRGLGRGLEALLESAPRDEEGDALLVAIDPGSVAANPEQPRRDFDEAGLQLLAESIRLYGLLHPIVVQRAPEGYRLVAGERRLRAAQLAGMPTIPAIVRPEAESGRHALEMALTENLMRADLNPIEEAAAYARLADAFGLTHEAIALRLGRSRPAISNAIRLLGLSAPVQEALAENRIMVGHARALLALPRVADQEAVAVEIEEAGLNVREVEKAVQRILSRSAVHRATVSPPPQAFRLTPDDDALQRAFERLLGMPVSLERRRRGGGGRVVIHFGDDSDLDTVYRRLGGPPL